MGLYIKLLALIEEIGAEEETPLALLTALITVRQLVTHPFSLPWSGIHKAWQAYILSRISDGLKFEKGKKQIL